MRIGVGINLARVGVLGGDFGVGLGPGGLGVQAAAYLGGIAPYHWLDFINNRALYAGADVGNVTQATGYSFSRASQGYYQNADGTLTLFGYNLLTWSQEFDNAAWTKTNTTVTANATTAPDGTTTAEKLVENSATDFHTARPTTSVGTITATECLSVFAKASERSWLALQMGSSRTAYFNLSAGTIGTTSANTTATMTALANGWYRCSVAGERVATQGNQILLASGDNTASYTGDGTSGIFIWGAQLDQAAQATAYVPTTTAAAGALRRGDRGVLIEGSRTNLLLQSQTFGTTWTAQRTTITENTIAAPDGTTTADTVLETVDNGSHGVFQAITKAASSITYALSCHIKPNGRNWAILQLDSAGETNRVRVWFDLTGSGVVGSNVAAGTGFSFVSASIQALANGWYRCVAVITGDTNTTYTLHVRPATADTTVSYAGDITKGLYLWGAQLEAASFPSSYTPTTSASVTRAADVLSYTAGVTYPTSLWCEFEPNVVAANQSILFASDGTSNNEAAIRLNAGITPTYFSMSGGVLQSNINVGTAAANTVYKFAARFATDSVRGAFAGTLGTADTSATNPATPTVLNVGSARNGLEQLFGYIRRAAVFNTALTDAQLQTVST